MSAGRHNAKHLKASLKSIDLDVVAAPSGPRSAVQFQIDYPIWPVTSQHESVAVSTTSTSETPGGALAAACRSTEW
jgi:hypothetical protein